MITFDIFIIYSLNDSIQTLSIDRFVLCDIYRACYGAYRRSMTEEVSYTLCKLLNIYVSIYFTRYCSLFVSYYSIVQWNVKLTTSIFSSFYILYFIFLYFSLYLIFFLFYILYFFFFLIRKYFATNVSKYFKMCSRSMCIILR